LTSEKSGAVVALEITGASRCIFSARALAATSGGDDEIALPPSTIGVNARRAVSAS